MIKTFRPASDAQARFITTLLADRAVPEALATATAEALASGTLSVGEASEAITLLKQLPRDWDKALCRPTSGGDSDAGPRYGREIGRCYRCNRTLTDAVSRSLGIGPDCRSKI
jgi:hypothetical protein